jgi:hypothetical protein
MNWQKEEGCDGYIYVHICICSYVLQYTTYAYTCVFRYVYQHKSLYICMNQFLHAQLYAWYRYAYELFSLGTPRDDRFFSPREYNTRNSSTKSSDEYITPRTARYMFISHMYTLIHRDICINIFFIYTYEYRCILVYFTSISLFSSLLLYDSPSRRNSNSNMDENQYYSTRSLFSYTYMYIYMYPCIRIYFHIYTHIIIYIPIFIPITIWFSIKKEL